MTSAIVIHSRVETEREQRERERKLHRHGTRRGGSPETSCCPALRPHTVDPAGMSGGLTPGGRICHPSGKLVWGHQEARGTVRVSSVPAMPMVLLHLSRILFFSVHTSAEARRTGTLPPSCIPLVHISWLLRVTEGTIFPSCCHLIKLKGKRGTSFL